MYLAERLDDNWPQRPGVQVIIRSDTSVVLLLTVMSQAKYVAMIQEKKDDSRMKALGSRCFRNSEWILS